MYRAGSRSGSESGTSSRLTEEEVAVLNVACEFSMRAGADLARLHGRGDCCAQDEPAFRLRTEVLFVKNRGLLMYGSFSEAAADLARRQR